MYIVIDNTNNVYRWFIHILRVGICNYVVYLVEHEISSSSRVHLVFLRLYTEIRIEKSIMLQPHILGSGLGGVGMPFAEINLELASHKNDNKYSIYNNIDRTSRNF